MCNAKYPGSWVSNVIGFLQRQIQTQENVLRRFLSPSRIETERDQVAIDVASRVFEQLCNLLLNVHRANPVTEEGSTQIAAPSKEYPEPKELVVRLTVRLDVMDVPHGCVPAGGVGTTKLT